MRKVIIGIAIAIIFWFVMFSPSTAQKVNFWVVMFSAGIVLSAYSLVNDKEKILFEFSFTFKTILLGIFSAVFLYFAFFIANLFFSFFFETTKEQISSVYLTKVGTSAIAISLLLLFVIGPAEEIFWRGFVQKNILQKTNKPVFSILITTIIYTLVHIWSFNPMLLLAALVCGLFWGYLYYKFQSLSIVIISHSLWDFLIFVLLPLK